MRTLSNILLSFIMTVLFAGIAVSQEIVINEVVYSNKTILTDKDGDTSDWIELYNKSNEPINITGYQITDDSTETELWTFPEHIMQPGAYLVIFASGKDVIAGTEFHLDFKLSLMQEALYLYDPNNELIDNIDIQCVPADRSLGRFPDGSEIREVMIPSPSITNNESEIVTINYIPDSVAVSMQSGFYDEAISVEISNLISDNTIKYTINGDIPDEDSPEFEGFPLDFNDLTGQENRFANQAETIEEVGNDIFKANILRTVAYSNGCPASDVISNVYFVSDGIDEKYDVPIVSIITEENNLFDDDIGIYVLGNHNNFNQTGKSWERPVHVEVFDESKNLIVDQDAGIRISGKGSRNGPQKSLRLYAREEYSEPYFEHPFFEQKPDLAKFETLLLRGTRGLSGTLLKDELTQNLVQDMNIDYSGSQTCIVFINGEYWGIYNIRERLDEGYVENNYDLNFKQLDIIGHNLSNIGVESGTIDAYNTLLNFIENADPTSDSYYEQASEFIDIPELIDFYIAELYYSNYDFPHNNLKMWKTDIEDSKWRFYFFDCDACMINLTHDLLSEYNSDIEMLQLHDEWSTNVFSQLLKNNEFKTKFSGSFYDHLSTTFSAGQVLSEINRLEAIYEPLVGEHTYRWSQPVDYIKWKENVEMLKIFAMQKPSIQIEQLIENFGSPFLIYPNPSTGEFTVEINSEYTNEANIKLYSCTGQLIYTGNIQTVDKQIALNMNLNQGIYIIQIIANGYSQSSKIIIQ